MSGGSSPTHAQEWVERPERGSLAAIKLGVRTALWLGRRRAQFFLYPVCLYFLLTSPAALRASRDYLSRVLGRRPGWRDSFRHFHTFGACVLDRAFLLNERDEGLRITVTGDDVLRQIDRQGGGCLLFGAHFGSFEAARCTRPDNRDLPVSLLMYEENARKIRSVLSAVNPRLETEIIGLGRLDSLITVADRLRSGHFVGVLADRNPDGRDMTRLPFLGTPADFPQGPFKMAMMLGRPVVMMAGLYHGKGHYEVRFEQLAPAREIRPADPKSWIDDIMRLYVGKLEALCREAPCNWFNFYKFWG